MQDLKNRFIEFYQHEIRRHPIWKDMENTVEDSPWHREDNVAIHTDMVVTQYLCQVATYKTLWDLNDLAGAFACAFHDFGKPAAEETKWSEERGEYRRYTGHEIISARLWNDYVADRETFIKIGNYFNLTNDQVAELLYNTAFMIEHHLPYGLKDKIKRAALARSVDLRTFTNVAVADCWGRISDDHVTKKENTLRWFRELEADEKEYEWPEYQTDTGEVILLIGAPGSGKSTYIRKYLADAHVYCWDQLRIDWYVSSDEQEPLTAIQVYDLAFKRACDDKQFNSKVMQEYHRLLKEGTDRIVIDNTNTSAKRRRVFINDARKHNYKVTVVVFAVDRDTLLSRAEVRGDKFVPLNVVDNMWHNTQMPHAYEVDELCVVFPFADNGGYVIKGGSE